MHDLSTLSSLPDPGLEHARPTLRGSYELRSYARTGVGVADTHEVIWVSPEGGRFVLTRYSSLALARLRLAFMRAPLGSVDRDQARAAYIAACKADGQRL